MDDAVSSLSALLGSSGPTLVASLLKCTLDWNHSRLSPEQQVLHYLGFEDEEHLPVPAAIRWFHATRTHHGQLFVDGLLPTRTVLPLLLDSVGKLAVEWISQEDWERYRSTWESSGRPFVCQFHRKAMAPGWEGPFAFLVKEAALGMVGDHKDFTRISEALEDICADFEGAFQVPLRAAYEAATRRCIVTFTRPGDWPGAVGAALNYVHRSVHHEGHSVHCNTVFSGEGKAVPPEWIDLVEWP